MLPSAAQMPGEVLSPSQASTFLSCSAKWWFRYGLGLPDPPAGGLVRGKAVHAIIEYALRAKMAGVVLETGALSDCWDVAWDEAAESAQFQACEDVEGLKASGARLAQKYVAEALPETEPAAVEVPVSGTIAGVPVRGIADIVTTDGMVIDIKTASRKPSGLAADHALQLATYATLLADSSAARRASIPWSRPKIRSSSRSITRQAKAEENWSSACIRWSPRVSRTGYSFRNLQVRSVPAVLTRASGKPNTVALSTKVQARRLAPSS